MNQTGQVNSSRTNSKSTKKRKYSSRMNQIAPHVTTLSSTYNYNAQSVIPQSSRTRNNIASQQSRTRRKLYMQVLEEQITNMQRQLQETNHQIESIRSQIFNELMHTDQNSQSAQIQSHVLNKLKKLLLQEKSNKRDTEINICLDSCIYRIGASGSQRKAILDILYSGMVNRTLPNIYRYLLWSAANHTHLFQHPNCKKTHQTWWSQIKHVGQKAVQDHQDFLTEQVGPLSEKSRQIILCSRQILKKKQQIERYGASYDQILKKMRKILTPAQFAELFLFAQRSVHKKELQIIKSQQESQKEETYERIPIKYKKTE